MAHLGGRLQGVKISFWLPFLLASYLTPKLGKSCLHLTAGNFDQFWAKCQRVIICIVFSGFFMNASYDLSFNKIWDVNNGTIWWFDMEWPFSLLCGFFTPIVLFYLMIWQTCTCLALVPKQGIIQQFNLGFSSHVSITLSCKLCSVEVWRGGGGGQFCKPPL